MSVETLYLLRRNEPRSDLQDLDRVALTAAVVTDDGDTIEAGTQGTIVGVWRDGAAYEVDFAQPEGALATVEAHGLDLVERAASRRFRHGRSIGSSSRARSPHIC